jgi:signal transduction histidine kinase
MRELRGELAAFPGLGRAVGGSVHPLSLAAKGWRSVRDRTGLDRLVGLRRQTAELRRQAELKDGFIALASHELRAPAAVIYGFAETLVERGGELGHDDLAELHGVLHSQARRLSLLVDQLLDLGRLEADVETRAPERLAVRDRLEEVVESVAGGRAGVVLRAADDLELVTDRTAFERIAANLVTNAIRHGRTPVEVCAEQRDRHFRLTVSDCGDGVPDALVPSIFERFARGGSDGGSGLGLSIAQAYAQANGGRVLYEPRPEGGARFQLVLPNAA